MGYLAHLVRAVFNNGSAHGVDISYHEEREPLGTAGALGVIDGLEDTFLAMNGDVLTALDFSELFRVHQESGNAFTIATHRRVVRSDYGVIYEDGVLGETPPRDRLRGEARDSVHGEHGRLCGRAAGARLHRAGDYFDVPDLVLRLLEAGEQVGSYLTDSYWLDIGRHQDYEQAIAEYEQLKHVLLREEAAAAMEAG